jgi:murein DD-endopeptidase MepM/ murein hydrolase activator NlpD
VWVLVFGVAAVWVPSSERAAFAASEEALPPDVETVLPSSSGFAFDCRVVTFPASEISFVRIWDGQPPESVSARDAGLVRIGADRVAVYGPDASYRPVDAHLGAPLIVDLGDRRRVVISDWVEKPDGVLVGFSYRVDGDPVYLDVAAGSEIYRGRLRGSGFWPPADLTPGEDSIELGVCPPEPITEVLSFTNGGSVPISVHLSTGPMIGADSEPEACDRFTVRISDQRSREPVFEGPLCDLTDTTVTLDEPVVPGEEASVTVEVHTVIGVVPMAESAPVGGTVAGSARVQWASDPSPDRNGWWDSPPWSWPFEVDFEGSPGPPDGFVTFTESAEDSDEYDVVWPARITDPPAVEVSDSGLVCPVIGGTSFGDTWGELRGSTRFHLGVDIPAPQGSPLVAIEGGTVHRSLSGLGGYELTIDAGDGMTYYYAHLSGYAAGLEDGSSVEAGTLVGFIGSTGNAAGPHLHMGLIVDGTATNPYPTAEAACLGTTGDEPPADDLEGAASVSGRVLYDIDRDGIAASEPGIAGIHVELLVVGLGVVADDVTDPDGAFRLGPVEPGTYRVRFRAPEGWEFTRQPDGGELGGDVLGVRSNDGRVIGYTDRFELEPDGGLSLDATLAPGESADQGDTEAP